MFAKMTAPLLALTLTFGAAGIAQASPDIDSARQDEIRTRLAEQGYEVRKIDAEDGMIEVYALKDGQRFELYLDDQLEIVRTKTED
ncbi:PepSY domain-containing protein [Salipiger mucosus]|uniref:PepSY domain-containing protein n=1 Tax=Salipiger mucosus DSM 16094 TaxID=1123237 RepID=S9RWX1_9RHOB|nr:PepSY domain-containing protein [Salipiger mucosus]EPX78499.1 hypothetical protein Salmuc_03609 [Salipiger mucosus DSM 16094]